MSMRQLVLDIGPARPAEFASFVVGSNAELIARLQAVASGSVTDTMLYLWGEPGSGRSHLLQATVRAATRFARYAPCGPLPAPVAGSLIAVDDVESLDPAQQLALFNQINDARETAGTVIAAGPTPPAHLPLREDVRSRLAWGLVFQVRMLSDDEKAIYLRAEAERRGLRLADEVIRYLLTHVRRDLPSLIAVIEHLDKYSLSHQRAVTLPLVRAALAE